MKDKSYKYNFGNRPTVIIVPAIGFLIFAGMTAVLYMNHIVFWVFAAAIALLLLVFGIKSISCRILIFEDGFEYQSFLFMKTYYHDSDIADVWTEDKLQNNGTYVHFFCFRTKDGKKVRYNFTPYLTDFADYLVARINGEDVTEFEEHLNREYL